MPAPSNRPQASWSFLPPDLDLRPKGPVEAYRRALEHLGPLEFRSSVDARAQGAVVTYGLSQTEIALSEEEAGRLIVSLAESFTLNCRLFADAPRLSDAVNQLQHIQTCAKALEDAIAESDDIVLGHLHDAAEDLAGEGDLRGWPPSGGWPKARVHREDEGDLGDVIDRLRGLGRISARARAELLEVFGDGEQADKGGRRNAWNAVMGNPREDLAREALVIFELFSGRTGTGTDGGPFHRFVHDVFEFATGVEPDAKGSLIQWVKAAVRERNQERGARERLHDSMRELRRIMSLGTEEAGTPELEERRRTLAAEVCRSLLQVNALNWDLRAATSLG